MKTRRWLLAGSSLAVAQSLAALRLSEPDASPTILGVLLTRADSPKALHRDLSVPILGELADLASATRKHDPDGLLICLPQAMKPAINTLIAEATQLGLTWRYLSTMSDQLAGIISQAGTSNSPRIDLEALIGRSPTPLDEAGLTETITGRTVLITGAAGSIGSELARIAACFRPALLILADRSENGLFQIDGELARTHPELNRRAQIHDVTQKRANQELFDRLRPEIVLHAAAHKHVPLMEDHPTAALENNFYGTRWVVDAAIESGVKQLVMISTDKAVNPSSIMGASKRLAELYIQHRARQSKTTLAMVRFGNVLGSACSVLPIWSEQLAQGGPLTVTHQDMTRYFMTIPEAAGLVLQAAGYARGGEVFLLDMGQPIRILDLAHRYLRQQGIEPDVDLEVRITGPRPGEKLFEELAYRSEAMTPTPHPSIRIWQTAAPEPARIQQILKTFDRLRDGHGHGPWDGTPQEAAATALRTAIPEMVTALAAAG
ncbi:MAG: polysaccharide biosynthesis protein [Phycisphaeraceae bacterium]